MHIQSGEHEVSDNKPKDPINILKDHRAAVAEKIEQAKQATNEARDAKDEYLNAIRQAFTGQTVRVTGYVELQEVMSQDGFEYDRASRYLDDAEARVDSIFLGNSKYGDNLTPTAYLSISGDGRDNVRVLPFNMEKFELVESTDEVPKTETGLARTALRR